MSAEEPYEIYARGYEAGHKTALEEAMSRDAAEKVNAWKESAFEHDSSELYRQYQEFLREIPDHDLKNEIKRRAVTWEPTP